MHNNILNLQRKEEAQKHLQSVFNVFTSARRVKQFHQKQVTAVCAGQRNWEKPQVVVVMGKTPNHHASSRREL